MNKRIALTAAVLAVGGFGLVASPTRAEDQNSSGSSATSAQQATPSANCASG